MKQNLKILMNSININSLSSSKLGFLRAFLAKISGTGLNLIFSIVLARLLGVADVGVYFLAITIINIGATIARLGLDTAALRFASTAYDENNRSKLSALYTQGMTLVIVAGILIAVLIWLVMPFLHLNSSRFFKLQAVLPLIIFAIIPTALIRLQGELFKAIGMPGFGMFIQISVLPIVLVIGASFLWWLGDSSLFNFLLLYFIGAIVTVLFAHVFWVRRVPVLWRKWQEFDTRLLLRTGIPLVMVSSLNLIMSWTSILVLSVWTDPSTVGLYGIAIRITSLMGFILQAVNAVVGPKFSTLYSKGSYQDMEKIAQKSGGWMLLIAFPMAFAFFLFPEFILNIFGKDFVNGAILVRILVLGQFINIALGSVGFLLIMSGYEKKYRNTIVISAFFNLTGNLTLVPLIGATGAALSTAGALILVKIMTYIGVYRELNINTIGYLFRKT